MEGLTDAFLFFIVKNSVVAIVVSMITFIVRLKNAFVFSLLATPVLIQLMSILKAWGLDDGFAVRMVLSLILAWPVIALINNLFKDDYQNTLDDSGNEHIE